jgi:YHS domain-containing protein
MKTRILIAVSATALAASLLWAGVDLTHAKCPVAGGSANADTAVDYKGGKVYFCCGGCDKSFKENLTAYAAKANHQLVVTGQAKQIACPLAGEPVDSQVTAKVDGATVAFCCAHCRESVEALADDAAKIEMLFNDAAFEKGFKVGD